MKRIDPAAFDQIKQQLAALGLLLCDLKAVSGLPEPVWLNTWDETEGNVGGLVGPIKSQGSLLLIGHAGKQFWQVFSEDMDEEAMSKPDPVDNYCADVTQQIVEHCLLGIEKIRMFPRNDCPINLMELGKAFGWHTPSPLGMGIHAQYGLWSAYRALWWLDAELVEVIDDIPLESIQSDHLNTDICSQCETQECVAACPVDAINHDQNPALDRCANYRLQLASDCESTCLARMACPHAKEHRYTDTQMAYHYELARSEIAKYY